MRRLANWLSLDQTQGARRFSPFWKKRSLRFKIVVWAFIPAAIILGLVALVTFFAYQQVIVDTVISRDQQVTRLGAAQLAAELDDLGAPLTDLARTLTLHPQDALVQQRALERAAGNLVAFDGVAVLDVTGRVVATTPELARASGQNWADHDYFRQLLRSTAPVYSNLLPSVLPVGEEWADALAVAVPIVDSDDHLHGGVVGLFHLGPRSTSALYGQIVRLNLTASGHTYLVDGNGYVVYHHDLQRVGARLQEEPAVRWVSQEGSGARRLEDAAGETIVAAYAPVPGTPWGLITEEAWSTLVSGYAGYQRFLLLLLTLGLLVPALIVAFGVRRLTQPLNDLIAAAQQVARGDFGQKIGADTGDEVEELAHQFNQMSAELATSYDRLEKSLADRTKELTALNAIAALTTQSGELTTLLDRALSHVLSVTAVDSGGVYLLSEDDSTLHLAAHHGFTPEMVEAIDNLQVGEGFSGRVVATGEPVIVADLRHDARLTRLSVRQSPFRSLASFPLRAGGQVLGALFVITTELRTFSREDVELLTSVANQVAVAVENARLLHQVQEAATQQERQRLARELHDAVTQTLFSATLIAEVLPRIWERDSEQGRQRLDELRELTRGALAEMRTLLLELRPSALTDASLAELLRQLTEAVTGRARLPVALDVRGDCELPLEVKVALYRIAQEALNNISKHAEATQVTVRLACGSGAFTLEVVDDGQGFDVADVGPDSLGLGIMRERATQIGAGLTVDSQSGAGTHVTVVWPGPDAAPNRNGG